MRLRSKDNETGKEPVETLPATSPQVGKAEESETVEKLS